MDMKYMYGDQMIHKVRCGCSGWKMWYEDRWRYMEDVMNTTHCRIWSSLSSSFFVCIKMKPMLFNLNASVINCVAKVGSKWCKEISFTRSHLIVSNAIWWSGSHWNMMPFLSNPWSFSVSTAKFSINACSWLARPKNLRNVMMFVGVGNFEMASNFLWLGTMPSFEIMNPANSTEVPISNFFSDKVKPCSTQRFNMIVNFFSKLSIFTPSIKILSTSFLTPSMPAMTASNRRQNLSEELKSPIGAHIYQYMPDGSKKVVR